LGLNQEWVNVAPSQLVVLWQVEHAPGVNPEPEIKLAATWLGTNPPRLVVLCHAAVWQL
jgi:hypothetical protein